MIRPKSLQPGDRLAVLCGSSPTSKSAEELMQAVRDMGLEPVLYPSATARHGFLSGVDAIRAADINAAFADESIKGIVCTRGGYGFHRILPLLDWKTIKKNPNKKNDTKNMTYERMAIYIREQENAAVLMVEFKKQIALSKVQTNPYRSVLAWFKQTFENYDGYKAFFETEAQKEAQKKDIFKLVVPSTVSDGEGSGEENFDLASGM